MRLRDVRRERRRSWRGVVVLVLAAVSLGSTAYGQLAVAKPEQASARWVAGVWDQGGAAQIWAYDLASRTAHTVAVSSLNSLRVLGFSEETLYFAAMGAGEIRSRVAEWKVWAYDLADGETREVTSMQCYPDRIASRQEDRFLVPEAVVSTDGGEILLASECVAEKAGDHQETAAFSLATRAVATVGSMSDEQGWEAVPGPSIESGSPAGIQMWTESWLPFGLGAGLFLCDQGFLVLGADDMGLRSACQLLRVDASGLRLARALAIPQWGGVGARRIVDAAAVDDDTIVLMCTHLTSAASATEDSSVLVFVNIAQPDADPDAVVPLSPSLGIAYGDAADHGGEAAKAVPLQCDVGGNGVMAWARADGEVVVQRFGPEGLGQALLAPSEGSPERPEHVLLSDTGDVLVTVSSTNRFRVYDVGPSTVMQRDAFVLHIVDASCGAAEQ